MAAPIIELNRVSKHFGDLQAVDDLSLSVAAGEFLVLLGPSGCGKTTTLRLLAGLETPDAGDIRLGGRVVAGPNDWVAPESRHIGMVFQDYALFPHLSVSANVAFPLNKMASNHRRERIAAMLELVGLPDVADRYPHELSGGQQQRIALARALAPNPDVVLLDEPFSNLDAALRKEMRDEVRSILQQAGATSVFVTHDQQEALGLADQIAIIVGGQLLQIGTPETIYARPADRRVASFVGEANFLPGDADGPIANTPLGPLPLTEAAQGPVDLLLRPEDIALVPASDSEQVTAVQVTWREYYGHDQRFGLQLNDGTTLVGRAAARMPITPGETRCVRVNGPVLAFPAQA